MRGGGISFGMREGSRRFAVGGSVHRWTRYPGDAAHPDGDHHDQGQPSCIFFTAAITATVSPSQLDNVKHR